MGSKKGRLRNNWLKTVNRRVAKMLAYTIFVHEDIAGGKFGERHLWNRMNKLYGPISEIVLGIRQEFCSLVESMESEKGLRPTPHHVYDRADKTKREDEQLAVLSLVERAYIEVVSGTDPQRCFPEALKRSVQEKQDDCCAVCHAPFNIARAEADHKQAHSRGGKTSVSNCQILCARCNNHKGTMSAQEYAESYQMKWGVK